MRWFVKHGLIGAAIGGGIAAAKAAQRSPEEVEEGGTATGMLVLRGATLGAVGGVSIGWIRGARAAKKFEKARAEEPTVLRLAHDGADAGRRLADRARPHIQEAGHQVSATLLPVVASVAEKAVDRLSDALSGGVEALHDAADHAKPAVASAVDEGRDRIEDLVDAGRERVAALTN